MEKGGREGKGVAYGTELAWRWWLLGILRGKRSFRYENGGDSTYMPWRVGRGLVGPSAPPEAADLLNCRAWHGEKPLPPVD